MNRIYTITAFSVCLLSIATAQDQKSPSEAYELNYKRLSDTNGKSDRESYITEGIGKKFIIKGGFWLGKDGRILFVSDDGQCRGSVAFSDKAERDRIEGATQYWKSEAKKVSSTLIATAAFRKGPPQPSIAYIAPPELVGPPRKIRDSGGGSHTETPAERQAAILKDAEKQGKLVQEYMIEFTGAAKYSGEVKPEPVSINPVPKEKPNDEKRAGEFAEFAGKWSVKYLNRYVHEYVIEANGTLRYDRGYTPEGKEFVDKNCQRSRLERKDGSVIASYADGKIIERFSLSKNGNLIVEHFDPPSKYPKSPTQRGEGTTIP